MPTGVMMRLGSGNLFFGGWGSPGVDIAVNFGVIWFCLFVKDFLLWGDMAVTLCYSTFRPGLYYF